MSESCKSSEESDEERKKTELKDKKNKKKHTKEKKSIPDDGTDDEDKQKTKKKISDKISFYLDGEEFKVKKCDLSLSLSELRTKLKKKINKTSLFLDKSGDCIKLENEDNFSISQILKDNKINLKTKSKNKKEIKEEVTPEDNLEKNNEKISDSQEEQEVQAKESKNDTPIGDTKDDKKEKKSKTGKEKESPNDDNKIPKKKKGKKKKKISSDEEDSSDEEEKPKKKKGKKKKKISSDEEDSSEISQKKSKLKNKKKKDLNDDTDITLKASKDMLSNPAPPIKKKNSPLPGCLKVEQIGDLDIYKYDSVNLTDDEKARAITIMVVGETGTGKTTLLNCYLNYLLGIELTDKFRYKIIYEDKSKFGGQHKSQTSKVTTYNIRRPTGNPIIIVDTPGFGDTGGIVIDAKTVKLIKDCFTKEISTINAVCFVTKASTNRLTDSQKYVFDSVLNLFGNDIKENFIIMITFCDGADPQIVDALQSDDSIFKDIIPYLKKNEWYLEFNNSAFFSTKVDRDNIKMFWKLGIESYERLTNKIEGLPAKSLTLTKQVLEERAKLENSVSNLTPQLDNALNIMNNFKTTIQQVEKLKGDVKDNKDFEIEVDEYYVDKIDLRGTGKHTTTCIKCNFTCHRNCNLNDDNDKKYCCAIEGEYCKECPGKCHWQQHKNYPYIIEQKKKKVKKTLDNLKKAYCDSNNKLSAKQQILNGLENDFNIQMIQCMSLQNQVQTAVERLKEIALNKRTHENSGQYIDQLIESEKMQKKEGYLERIQSLNELKKKHGLISDLFKRQENKTIKDLNQFTKEYIEKMKKKNNGQQLKAMTSNKDCVIF